MKKQPKMTALMHLYRWLTVLLQPLAFMSVSRKLRSQGIGADRIRERLGYATCERAEGPVLWFHAASVGESLSVLTIIRRIGEQHDGLSFVITSGTAASAAALAKRLPPRTTHQFAPLDSPMAVNRFLGHWTPAAAVFVESELWPTMLWETHRRDIPIALLNARLSRSSVKSWQRIPKTARSLLGLFELMISQNETVATALVDIGAEPEKVVTGSNIKALSDPLPVATDVVDVLASQIGNRAHWVASSTHSGEEPIVLEAFAKAREQRGDLLCLLVPRHPIRGDEVETLIKTRGFSVARRSRGETIGPGTDVYLADTIGETGTWYALSPIVFLGGSLLDIGGHNPFEPAQAGAALMSGPHVTNFAETYGMFEQNHAVTITPDADAIAETLGRWLGDDAALAAARDASRRTTESQSQKLMDLVNTLTTSLNLKAENGRAST